MDLKKDIINEKEEIIHLRRELHKIPELGFNEFETSRFITDKLKQYNIEVKNQIANTGVLGIIKGNKTGKTIMVRADMDGLPIVEANTFNYASKNKGVMHACGHDGHMAITLTVAKILSKYRSKLNGNLKFLFQPAEEGPGGAHLMVKEGILKNPQVDALLSLHIWNLIPVGKIGVRPGPLMASINTFKLTVKGKASHGAMPQDGIDAIVVSSNIINILQAYVTREISPLEPCVLTIGKISGGVSSNIIADTVIMEGTFRTLNQALSKKFPEKIEHIVKEITKGMGAGYNIEFDFYYPVTINDKNISLLVSEAAEATVGKSNVLIPEQTMGGDDVAVYLQKVPGCHFFLGASNKEKGLDSPLHNPNFNFDENCLIIGVEVLLRSLLKYLSL
ncbi:MAG: M20 family metallopeptidase [Actinobacteria bacterium]|nr:M20 family metallopeptidase [Actinomycetota bacterium]